MFASLRQREAQARAFGERHLVAVRDTNSMLFWLAEACRTARKEGGRRQVHIAASTAKGVDQSTVTRFEKHTAWPKDPDALVAAYADDLDVPVLELWAAALGLWRRHQALSPSERAEWEAAQTAQRTRAKRRASGTGRAAPRPDSPVD